MFPPHILKGASRICLPRIRGGVSKVRLQQVVPEKSSPHTRGCFHLLVLRRLLREVFPAYAGVFPWPRTMAFSRRSLPRIRGGVSTNAETFGNFLESSPHTRGCFFGLYGELYFTDVFPAYAGVFPTNYSPAACLLSLPRIRGGVSIRYHRYYDFCASSPHTRGCFFTATSIYPYVDVFPAYAGVFRHYHILSLKCHMSSPHTRGCFCEKAGFKFVNQVFPAYAGVFPALFSGSNPLSRLPRIRGGVSTAITSAAAQASSSPHTRGCFRRYPLSRQSQEVFPAYAGVFPRLKYSVH